MRFSWVWVIAAVSVHVCAVHAQDFSKLSEEDRRQVNEWMAERAEKMIEANKVESELSQAWADTRYSNPSVDALRTRFRQLQDELASTMTELKKKIQEVPEVQVKQKKLDEMKARVRELSQKVDEKAGVKPQQ